MTKKTGTLWEHDKATASCNHGFASSIGEIILKCVAGYQGVVDGKPVFTRLDKAKDYGVEITLNEN